MNLVLDASTALSWAFEDEADPQGDRVMELLRTESAVVPPLWELEVANGLVVAARRGRIEAAYLDLALRYRIPLATRDRALARAAEAELVPSA